MLWPSYSVKKEHREIDKIAQEETNVTVINDKFKKKHVDGVKFDTEQLLRYLVQHVGLAEKAK
jgi:DNA-binding LacI/PurR family transcriptional regulator